MEASIWLFPSYHGFQSQVMVWSWGAPYFRNPQIYIYIYIYLCINRGTLNFKKWAYNPTSTNHLRVMEWYPTQGSIGFCNHQCDQISTYQQQNMGIQPRHNMIFISFLLIYWIWNMWMTVGCRLKNDRYCPCWWKIGGFPPDCDDLLRQASQFSSQRWI